MNGQEALNALKQGLTFLGALATGAGLVSATEANTITSDVLVAVPALVSLGSMAWSIYSHWNMKKVPETAKVVSK